MLVWLDLVSSHKENPNENFARELMELFTLGEGHYTESDIKESAKAFTGYRIDPIEQTIPVCFESIRSFHKVFMKKAGPWNGDQIIDIILEQPQCARFIVKKIWRFFAYEDPDPSLIDALAARFRQAPIRDKAAFANNLQLGRILQRAGNGRDHQESGSIFGTGSPFSWRLCTGGSGPGNIYRQLGQIPFYPPNVKGWDGGKSWINTGTLAYRYQIARWLINGIRPEQVGFLSSRRKTASPAEPEPTGGTHAAAITEADSPPIRSRQLHRFRHLPHHGQSKNIVVTDDRRTQADYWKSYISRFFNPNPTRSPQEVHRSRFG